MFLFASLLSALLALIAVVRLARIIGRGTGKPAWDAIPARFAAALIKSLTLSTVFTARPLTSLMHGLVAWGFVYYVLVNVGDVLQGFLRDYTFLGSGLLGNLYRLGADILSVSVLLGMLALIARRFVLRPRDLRVRDAVALHPKAKRGIPLDSAIVSAFILLHVGARLLGESFHLASSERDVWQPVASALAMLWENMPIGSIEYARHVAWWISLGLILVFIPYFPQSKHIHLFFAPLNLLLHPDRRSMGELDRLDFEDEHIEQFGAERLEHLPWKALIDAYACIMCNRCQDACPAYETGKVLSPAAMEINKRYSLNQEGSSLARGAASSHRLVDIAIPEEAIWACTACGACIEICPVGNEPMLDIIEIRRHLVLMENAFPEQLKIAYRGMERTANPWNISGEQRLQWAQGLHIPTISENPEAEMLWWVGCAPATDPQAQKSARAFARILNAAGVNFAVLGAEERCTGDSARRSGNEYLFSELAIRNVEVLNRHATTRIVTTCPHCLHTLKNEYPAFGGFYDVIHHTALISTLLEEGRLPEITGNRDGAVTFHDPCYLGRMNELYDAPRNLLEARSTRLHEMSRCGARSFCCGAGGGQMWKEEEQGVKRVSSERVQEALQTGADTLAVACPFCMIMLHDAAGLEGDQITVRDVAEILADTLNEEDEP